MGNAFKVGKRGSQRFCCCCCWALPGSGTMDQHKNDTSQVSTAYTFISVCVAFALSFDTPLTSRPRITKQTLLNVEASSSFINDNVTLSLSLSLHFLPAKKKKERSLPSRNTDFDRACVTRNLPFRLPSPNPTHTHTQTASVSRSTATTFPSLLQEIL